jgi:hypothetical protein
LLLEWAISYFNLVWEQIINLKDEYEIIFIGAMHQNARGKQGLSKLTNNTTSSKFTNKNIKKDAFPTILNFA